MEPKIYVDGEMIDADIYVANLLCGLARPNTPKAARLVQELNHAIRRYESTFKQLSAEYTYINNLGVYEIAWEGRVLIAAAWERYQKSYARISAKLLALVIDHDRRNERRIVRQEDDDWWAATYAMRAGY